ncbi:MAG: RNA methyltransferase [Bacteroidales bacterium]|jgi:TrmH family RNA methyltransferase|nr:RNA methyltransferase [Bacteroidales bacterium]MDY0314598.1 RNA methyltransferase [Bacteroidales bacterium]NLB86754.1 RNA methyltransferase [Bacteroidales bacterium]
MKKLSKSQISLINSLKIKKYRIKENLFVVEGEKIVNEVLESDLEIKWIFVLPEYFEENKIILEKFPSLIYIIKVEEMKKISSFVNPSPILAVIFIPENKDILYNKEDLYLALDEVQDPGNLGNIIRICDWFGIKNLICSPNCADLYSAKTLQSTMGAFLRTNIVYSEIDKEIAKYKANTNNLVFGTFLKGENIYKSSLPKGGFIIMGNEGKGINKTLENLVDKKLFIPSFSEFHNHAESLNVSVACSIICSEFKRNLL